MGLLDIFLVRNGKQQKKNREAANLLRQALNMPDKTVKALKIVTRLFYTNEEVATFNYESLLQLKQPIAKLDAKHSSSKAAKINNQDMNGLEPTLFISKGAHVMHKMNLWPSVGFCNGAIGKVVDTFIKRLINLQICL